MAESIYPSKDANFWSERLGKINRLIESTKLSSYSGKEFSGGLSKLISEYKDKNYILKVDEKGNRIPWDKNLNQPWSDTAVRNVIKFGELGGKPLSSTELSLLQDLRTVIEKGSEKDQGSFPLSIINLLRGSDYPVQLPDGTETTEGQLYIDNEFTDALQRLQKGLGSPESSEAVQRALSEQFPDIFSILTGETEEPVENILGGNPENPVEGILGGKSTFDIGQLESPNEPKGQPGYDYPAADMRIPVETNQPESSNEIVPESTSPQRLVDPPAREDQTEEFKAFLRAYPHLRNSDGKIAYETMQANKHGIIMDALTLEELGP